MPMFRNCIAPIALVLAAVACQGRDGRRSVSAEDSARFRQTAQDYDTLARRLAQSIPYIGAPLKTLNREQQASLAALLVIARAAGREEAVLPPSRYGTIDAVWNDLIEICPPLRGVSFSRGGCLDAEIAYASAMSKCHNEGKTDDQCEREAAPEAAAAVACHMKALEALRGIIRQIPGRQWPPRPFPWPIAAGGPGS